MRRHGASAPGCAGMRVRVSRPEGLCVRWFGCGWNFWQRGKALVVVILTSAAIAACARSGPPPRQVERPSTVDPRYGTSPSPRLFVDGAAIPKGGGIYKVGVPYQIAGRWYTPREEPDYDRTGVASWYGDDFHGRKTANGEIYDMRALSAAHPTLPLPSYVWVSSASSRRTVLVRVNDRGPYAHDRIIDLSRASARALGFEGKGLAQVRVRYAGPAPLNGDDRREQAFLRSQPWYGAAPVGVAGRGLPYLRPYAAGAGFDNARGGRWRPTSATASIVTAGSVGSSGPVIGVSEPADRGSSQRGQGQGAAVVAGQFRSRANADRRAAELVAFGRFRVFAVPAAREPQYEVRSDGMDSAGAEHLRRQLIAAGISDARIARE